MRIIAGTLKGRKLYTPADRSVRPTSDKVKEALFSMIAPWTPEAIVLDLFCGTGSLGLEAISRGAKRVYFADKSRDSLALTKQNIAYCRVPEQAVVLPGEYDRVLPRIKEKTDIVLLDPPYKDGLLRDCIGRIDELELLDLEGVIAAEHSTDDPLPEQLGNFVKWRERRYGKIALTLYRREESL